MFAGEVAVEVREPIDHGRIAFQPDSFFKTIVKNRRYDGTFKRHSGLLFDNRSQGHHLVNGKAKCFCLFAKVSRKDRLKSLEHGGNNLVGRSCLGKIIRVRKKIAFECIGINPQSADQFGIHGPR